MTNKEILELLESDPQALHTLFPADHIEHSTIDIAVDWMNNSSGDCFGCVEQVADVIRMSLENLDD